MKMMMGMTDGEAGADDFAFPLYACTIMAEGNDLNDTWLTKLVY